MIKFVDLQTQYAPLRAEHEAAIARVMDSCRFIQGEEVALFEQELAEKVEASYCIGVSSGTDALLLSLLALGIGAGDEVLVPTNTFMATPLAVARAGAKPVFVDMDPWTHSIDLAMAESMITERTRAIIPVHLYGYPVDMEALLRPASRHSLHVIEDACQGFGGKYGGKPLGSHGHISAVSFFPSKNLGCFGDGGAVVTNNPALAEKVRWLREYGQESKHNHQVLGGNHRLDTIQAAVLRVNLRYVDEWLRRRRELAAIYRVMLSDAQGLWMLPPDDSVFVSSNHLFVIKHPERDRLQEHLAEQGVQTQIHYPVPCHQQPCFASGVRLPFAEHSAGSILSLPLYPALSELDVLRVCDKIVRFCRG